jgi:hypothetical protein
MVLDIPEVIKFKVQAQDTDGSSSFRDRSESWRGPGSGGEEEEEEEEERWENCYLRGNLLAGDVTREGGLGGETYGTGSKSQNFSERISKVFREDL